MSKKAWDHYDTASAEFFEIYESLTFEAIHRDLLDFLPPPGAVCLDVGAGSGRDAAALAERGYEVVAIEPSESLRRLAQKHHRNTSIEWIADSLPNLATIKNSGRHFDFVLLSAVWMHVPPEHRLASLKNLTDLLNPRGRIALTLRIGTPNLERMIHSVSVGEVLHQAEQVGLAPVYVSEDERDSLGRIDVKWKKIVLALPR